jgi:hypothetical protein
MTRRAPFAVTTSALSLLALACAREPQTTAPLLEPEAPALAKTAPPTPAGTLSLCKVAGAGVATGTIFTFDVVLAGVARVADVSAGSCLHLTVPVDRAPSSKGWYQRKTDDVSRLVPAGTELVVDAAALDAAQVSALLRGTAQASSSLLLNLVQQLLAADLNVLRGAQPTSEVAQAIADANAGVAIDPGPPIVVSTSLGTAEMSALVNTLTKFNEGKLVLPPAPATTQLAVTEREDALSEVQSIVCSPSAACTGIDLANRSVDAATSSGQTTTVTFTNRGKPVLRICKVAGAGIVAGSMYRFTAGGIDVNDAQQADVAAGDCEDLVLLEGSYMLVESVPDGEAVQSILCAPSGACTSPSPSVGQVNVAIVRGLTTVTYTNRSIIGTLRVCKVAGTGVSAGTVFRFTAGGTNDVAVYDVAAGGCEDEAVEEGDYLLNETLQAGIAVSAIDCAPAAACTSTHLGAGTANVIVTGATLTTVTFTNRSIIGTLRICKVAGAGVAPGTVFTFSAGGIDTNDGASYSVGAGSCEDEPLPEGTYSVGEGLVAGTAVSAIDCTPVNACSNPSLTARAVTAVVTGAALTTVTFTNRSIIATLRICKIAGTGQSGVFTFSAGGIDVNDAASYTVAAGQCQDQQLEEGNYLVAESIPAGSAVSDISCAPTTACSNVNVSFGVLHASLVGATLTTVTFTNVPSSGDDFALHGGVGPAARSGHAGPDPMVDDYRDAAASFRIASIIAFTRSGSAAPATSRSTSRASAFRALRWARPSRSSAASSAVEIAVVRSAARPFHRTS